MNYSLNNIKGYTILLLKLFIARTIFTFQKKKDLWIISERGNEARDNGFVFHEYILEHHPEINLYFVISKSSNDYDKLKKNNAHLIQQGSLKHYILFWHSTHLISTHVYGATPDPARFYFLNKKYNILKNKIIVFLQHGITKEKIPVLFGNVFKVDLFISGAKPEHDFLLKYFKHPDGIIRYTGFPRYDNLNEYKLKRQILLMPTWRSYLNKNNFYNSDYLNHYISLLSDRRIHSILETNNLDLVFYPHFEIQPFLHHFTSLPLINKIKIADFQYDVQTLLKESCLLITDYSSVYFDFAYMKKPIISWHFDEDRYYSRHYPRGEYEGDKFGAMVYSLDELVDSLNIIISQGMIMETKYKETVDVFFPIRDNNNCQRVFDAINQINKGHNRIIK